MKTQAALQSVNLKQPTPGALVWNPVQAEGLG